MLGSSSRRIRKASGIHVNSCPVRNPMVKHGLLGFATRGAVSPAASTCDSTRRAWSRKVRPAGVNSIPRARRVSSCAPTSSSRSRICRLSDGCDVCSFRPAATVILPASAIATKYRRCRSSISPPMPARHRCQLNKVCCQRGTATSNESVNLSNKRERDSRSRRKTMTKKLDGKIALITGGSRGIGAAIAKRLAADGANVAITYTKGTDAAASVVKEIERDGRKAIAIQADATDADAVEAAVEKTVATFGRLDVLVNNAGTAIPKRFEETTLEELDRLIDINVRGTFVATQAALKHMKSGGRIIMIGSCVGERAMTPGLVPYSATKGAVKMFTQGLSREVGSRGITVNNIQPGPIDTDLNPAAGDGAAPQKANTALDRYGSVDEVAALVAFVAGPEASYITGANLTVDGGTNA